MGRTKRLRRRKRNDVKSNQCFDTICLYNYMRGFSWNNQNKLICRNFANTGRGLCSKTGLNAGDVVINLPLEAMLTLASIENDRDFQENTVELKMLSHAVSFQSLLAFYILYRKHLDDNESKIKVYLDSIPKTFATPYFCSSEELYFLPETILQQTVHQNKNIRNSYGTFKNAFGEKNCKCCGQSYMLDIFTLRDFKWAYFAVNSRSVFLCALEMKTLIKHGSNFKQVLSDEPEMAMAPFLDMFNHIDTASTKPEIVNENNSLSFQLITNDSYKPYEQIFISYGNLTNLKLFTDYGFSLKKNLHDYFEISLADIESLIKSNSTYKGIHFRSNKFKFIRDHNLNDQMFIHAVDGLSHNLQVTLYLIFNEESHFTNVLNHTAFGSNIDFENSIQEEAKRLTLYKIREYQSFKDGLLKLNELSYSGQSTVQFLTHSLNYLRSYLDKFCLEVGQEH